MLFENGKFKIKYIEECIDNDANRSFIFTVDIKDFDTPTLNLVYDLEEDIIVKTYIDEQSAFSAVKGVVQEDSKFEAFDEFFENSRVVDFQDHFYPAELPASDMIQTYLLDGDKNKFLNNFQKEWLKANRQYIKE